MTGPADAAASDVTGALASGVADAGTDMRVVASSESRTPPSSEPRRTSAPTGMRDLRCWGCRCDRRDRGTTGDCGNCLDCRTLPNIYTASQPNASKQQQSVAPGRLGRPTAGAPGSGGHTSASDGVGWV